jgi:sterol desaturase/sphingolipid hydroxylase (fatty acid hydroxylase superfamily)
VRVRESIEAHSGYYFRGSWADKLGLVFPEQAAHHDFHHANRSSGNFGCEWLDLFHETQDAYVAIGFAEGYMASKARPRRLFIGRNGQPINIPGQDAATDS